jgi:thiamine biosynthesis lipoprotein
LQSKIRLNINLLKFPGALLLLLFLLYTPVSAQNQLYEFTASKYLMGTKFDISAVSTSVDSMKKAMYYALKEVERIQTVMSSRIDSSEITHINNEAGVKPVKVSIETYSIIQRSKDYSKKYNGLFDISIGPITELWGFNSEHPVTKVPDKNIIDSLIKLVNYEKIILNPSDTSVYLSVKGMKLDLGGIAKGYAVDRAAKIMEEHGMKNFFVNGGGDMYVSGYKQESQKWAVGIKHPREENKLIAELEISDGAVGTSGDYERFVIIDGKRYCHIFNTKTGYPVDISESGTAIAPTTEEAVILSKILFINGGNKYVNNTSGVPGMVVDSNGKMWYDENLLKQYSFRVLN